MNSSSPSTTNSIWTTQVRDACLRRMRLTHKEDIVNYELLYEWLAATASKSSLSTQQAMTLLLQRLLVSQQQQQEPNQPNHQQPSTIEDQSTLVGDLVHVYYMNNKKKMKTTKNEQNEVSSWTVGSCAQQLMEQLSNAAADQEFPALITDPTQTWHELEECRKQSQDAAAFFYSFWTVWDKVGMAFLGDDEEEVEAVVEEKQTSKENTTTKTATTPSTATATATTTSTAITPASTAAKPPPPPPAATAVQPSPARSTTANGEEEEEEEEGKDAKHDILILAWKMACLIQADDLVAPTAALALLLAMAHLNKESEDGATPPETTAAAAAAQNDQEPPTKKARPNEQEAHEHQDPNTIPSPESNRFLPWLISTIQKPRPITRPSALGPPIPASAIKNTHNLTVDRIQEAIYQLLDDLVHEWTDVELTTPPTRPTAPSSWMRGICQHIAAHGQRHKAVHLRSLTEKLPALLTSRCRRVVGLRDYCNPTHLMAYYLETGNDPALAMYETPVARKTMNKQKNAALARKKLERALLANNLAAAMEVAVGEISKVEESPDVVPPVVTEMMELTEWTVSLLCLDHVKPSRKLVKYLQTGSGNQSWPEIIYPILNKALLQLANEGMVDKRSRTAPVSITGDPGMVQIHGDVTPDKQLAKAIIALYFHALEAVLAVETSRPQTSVHSQIVQCTVFHRALLACCCWCTTKAIGATQKLRAAPSLQALSIYATLQVCESNPYDFLKVSDSFVRALTSEVARGKLGSPLIFALPRILQADLQQVEMNVSDSLLWARTKTQEGNLAAHIDDFREKTEESGGVTLWPVEVLAPTLREEAEDQDRGEEQVAEVIYPSLDHEDCAEYKCINFLIRKIVKIAYFRLDALCRYMNVPDGIPVATQAWVAFRYLLRNHVDVFFNRHIDHWILCCLYGVSKMLKYDQPELTFARIIEAYVVVRGTELGDVTCQRIVRHIHIEDDQHNSKPDNIIALYNRVFVPIMRQYLLGSKSLKRCASEIPELLSTVQVSKD